MRDLNLHSLRRVLSLRQFPFFEHAELDELATIAENLAELTIPAGTVIANPGSRLRAVQLILDGHIVAQPQGAVWPARHVYGALEVFANRPVTHTAVAATSLRVLQLSASDIGEVLEDNFGVLRAVLRELASRVLARGAQPRQVVAAGHRPLGLVERVITLRQQLAFTSARLQALATLAHACDEVSWPPQTIVARAGDLASSAFMIISGSTTATRGAESDVLHPGASVGLLETLASAPLAATVETKTPVRALRCTSSALLDVMEDHPDVGLSMLGTFAGALLDGQQQPEALLNLASPSASDAFVTFLPAVPPHTSLRTTAL